MNGFDDLERLAQRHGWKAEDPLALSIIARQLKSGNRVTVVQLAGRRDWQAGKSEAITVVDDIPADPDPAVAMVVITDRTGRRRPDVDRLAVLRPPTITLGVACRREVEVDDLEDAFRELCGQEGVSPLSLSAVGASDRRRDLAMLESFTERRHVPMLYYADAILRKSPWTTPGRMAGTCAVSAILAAGTTQPLVPSRPFFGKLSLALARRQG